MRHAPINPQHVLVVPAAFALIVLSMAVPTQAAEFISLENAPGVESRAYGVSDDGKFVAGYFAANRKFEAFRWTDATGIVSLGFLPGANWSSSTGNGHQSLSGDGTTTIGRSFLFDSSIPGTVWSEGFVHTEADGMRGVGARETWPQGVSDDGRVVTGYFTDNHEGFYWTENEGVVRLGFLPDDNRSQASSVSGDGSTIIGLSWNDALENDYEVFTYTETSGMVATGLRPGFTNPLHISNGGTMITGRSFVSSEEYREAFVWTEESDMVGLGWLPGTEGENGEQDSGVRDMTPDGRLIVGRSGPSPKEKAFVWSETGGMEDFQQTLIDEHGLGDSLAGWNLAAIQSVSANGQYFVGWSPANNTPSGEDTAWLVRLDAPWGTTVPEPSSIGLLVIGLTVISKCRLRR